MSTHATFGSPSSSTSSTLRWFPILVLLFALVPLGANSLPALNILLLLVSLAFLAQVLVLSLRDGMSAACESLLAGTDLTALMALPMYVALQLAMNVVRPGQGPVFEMGEAGATLVTLALFYLLVRSAVSDHRSFRTVLGGLTFVGAAEALYGLLNLLAGNGRLLIYKRWIFFDSATGTLSSRNHFAFLMEMLLPASVAFAVLFGRSVQRSRGGQAPEWMARTALIATTAIVCGLALFFSHSRMGVLSFVLAFATVSVLDRTLRPAEETHVEERRTWAGLGIAFASLALVLAGAIGLDSVLERFLRLETDLAAGRWPIWQAALAMFLDKPIFGQGWGTFEALLPSYRSAPTGFFYTHAHNDYFEVLAEGGIVGFAIAASLVALFARRMVRTLALPLTNSQRTVIVWLSVAITSTLFHSLADYGLRIPGVAFTFAALAAVYSRVTEEPALVSVLGGRRHRRHRSRKRAEA